MKIGQGCGFPTQNFSSLALKGTKILTFARTHCGFETGLQLGNLLFLHDMNLGLISNVFIILFSSSLWPQSIYNIYIYIYILYIDWGHKLEENNIIKTLEIKPRFISWRNKRLPNCNPVSKPQWVRANVNIFVPFNARELKFCVGNPHPWPIFNLIGPVEAKLVFLLILFL